MNFEQIQWNKVFCRIYGLAVIEVMTLSGHLSNIDEITAKIRRSICPQGPCTPNSDGPPWLHPFFGHRATFDACRYIEGQRKNQFALVTRYIYGHNSWSNNLTNIAKGHFDPQVFRPSLASTLFWSLSIFNIIRWFAGLVGRSSQRPSVWCSKYYFFINLQK